MLYALLGLAALARLLPHPMNFAPIGAMGLFAGAHGRDRKIWLWALALLLAGDATHEFYSPLLMAFVYAGFAAAGLIGWATLRSRMTAPRVALAALGSASTFFVLSNFGCWVTGMFPPTAHGLAQCYLMALPLYPNTLLGDLFYSGALFGLYALAERIVARRAGAGIAGQGGVS